MMKKRYIAAIVVLIPLLVLFRFVRELRHDREQTFSVTKVVDGDTAELNGFDMVRLLGIDTPERGEPFYDSARSVLSSLVKGMEVELRFDYRRRDKYGRLLAYLYIDSLLVNAEIVRAGYARIYLFKGSFQNEVELPKLLEAQRIAMKNKIGIWNFGEDDEPYYIANNSTMRFHRPSCGAVQKLSESRKVIFDQRHFAYYDGYSPCRNCKP